MKKGVILILLTFLFIKTDFAYAENFNNNRVYQEWLNEDGKIKIYPTWYEKEGKLINAEIYNIDWAIPKLVFMGYDGEIIEGIMTYQNYNEMVVGNFDLKWIFTPNNEKYEIRKGVFRFYLFPKDSEKSKGKIELEPEKLNEATTPSLTATSMLLEMKTVYDINLNNKVSGSKYKWISGNPKVAKVNAKNGLVTAVSEGETIVTCEITLPDNSTQKLESLVIVGYDENAPILTENELELEVGEKFTIGVENLVKGSKVSWKSSDKSIVKISSVKGKITTINEGEAYVTCTVTTPQNQVIVLKCDVSVTK